MQLQLAIVIGTIIIGGAITANFAFTENSLNSENTMKSTAGLLGHLTLTAINEDGEVIAYRQTDNVVINRGDNCLIDDTFETSFSTCTNSELGYTFVHIGEGGDGSVTETDNLLTTFFTQTGGTVGSYVSASGSNGASVTVTADFLNVSRGINEAALANTSTQSGDYLALQEFATITLGQNDDLKIEWTVTIDGS